MEVTSEPERSESGLWPEYMPVRQAWAEPFWKGLAQDKLLLQKCNNCNNSFYPPVEKCCTNCGAKMSWSQACGKARLWSWITFHREYYPGYPLSQPYTLMIVELPEGVRMLASLACGIEPADLYCDMEMKFKPLELSPGVFIPGFAPE